VARALVRILEGAGIQESELELAVNSIRTDRSRKFYLGHAYETAGDIQGAIEAYEAYLSGSYFDMFQFVLHLPGPVVHEKLGILYEAAGDSAKAVEHYRAFTTAWEDADPPLQSRLERARRSMERLNPDPSSSGPKG
jgi:hypothetical protein